MGNPCAILLLIVFSYRCQATHRGRTLSVLYRTPRLLIDGRFFIAGAYRARFPAKTWKPGPWPLPLCSSPAARHAWPVARGPWPVVAGPRFAWIDSRALSRGPWPVARVGGPESRCPFAKVSAHFAAIPEKWPTCLGAGALARFHTNNHSQKTNVLLIH